MIGTEIKLTKDHLIKLARKQTALQSFGADFWEEPLERLLDSVNREAQLTPVGRFITQKRLVNMLVIRLRAEQAFKKYPEILEQQLYPVQLICGLQRTGTTKLQRLLAADPDNRVLLSWEAINPVPFNDKPNEKEDRIKVARLSEKALRLMAPGFFSNHPVEYKKPEEDILLLDNTFLSTTGHSLQGFTALAGHGLALIDPGSGLQLLGVDQSNQLFVQRQLFREIRQFTYARQHQTQYGLLKHIDVRPGLWYLNGPNLHGPEQIHTFVSRLASACSPTVIGFSHV